MIDILTVSQVVSALVALLVTGLIALGFVRLARAAEGLIGNLAFGIVTIHAATFLRTLYRDILPMFVDVEILFARVMFLSVTLALNVLIVLSGWHGLRALHLAIPEPQRARYSMLTAALYPPLRRR